MLPMLMFNSLAARYLTLDECYSKPSQLKINVYDNCLKQAAELEDVFRPEFSVKSVQGITGFNCKKFTYTTDIYVELPVYTGQNEPGHVYVLVCRRVDTKDHTRYEFSHALYQLTNDVKVRLFDICPNDIDYYYSLAKRLAIRREVGELV